MKNPYVIDGDVVSISIGNGFVVLVDIEDLNRVAAIPGTWSECRRGSNMYAAAGFKRDGKPNVWRQYMHRFIIGASDPKAIIDHRNHNGLDNRRSNLRVVTKGQNNRNIAVPHAVNTSGVCSVYWSSLCRKWAAQSVIDGKKQLLGLFDNRKSARECVRQWVESQGLSEFVPPDVDASLPVSPALVTKIRKQMANAEARAWNALESRDLVTFAKAYTDWQEINLRAEIYDQDPFAAIFDSCRRYIGFADRTEAAA